MRRIWLTALTTGLLLLGPTTAALADSATGDGPGFNPGLRLADWLQRNVAAIFAPVLAVVAIYYLVRRQFTAFLSFAVFAGAVSLFVFAAGDFKDVALGFTRWVLGR